MLYCVYKYVDASVVLRRGHRRLRGHFGRGPDVGGGRQQPAWASHGHPPDAVNVRSGQDHCQHH